MIAEGGVQLQSIEEARAWVASDMRRMVVHGAKLRGYRPPQHHYIASDFLMGTKPHWRRRIKVMLGFRYSAKTWLFRQYVKFRWRRNPWCQVIIHSSNDDMSKRFAAAIFEELHFDPLMHDLAPDPTSSKFEFNLRGVTHEQGASLVCAGIKTSMTGSRADLYGFDDPEPEVDPEALRDRIVQAFGEAGDILASPSRHLHRMHDPQGNPLTTVPLVERTQLFVIGQPHHINTAYIPRREDFEEGGDGHPLIDAAFLVIPVLYPDGSWRWPEMMEQKYFHPEYGRGMTPKEVERSMPTSRWQLQYCINAKFAEAAGPVLRLNEIEWGFKILPHNIAVIDPADSETGCEWGIAIGGLFESKIHISYLSGIRGEAFDFLEDDGSITDTSLGESTWGHVFDRLAEFNCHTVMIEKNLKSAMTSCRRYVRRMGIRCTVLEYAAKRNKVKRIPEILEQPVNNGMISANPTVFRQRENIRQMTKLRWDSLPKPNDRLDAFAGLVEILIEEPHLYNVGSNKTLKFPKSQTPQAKRAGITSNAWERIKH